MKSPCPDSIKEAGKKEFSKKKKKKYTSGMIKEKKKQMNTLRVNSTNDSSKSNA